MGQPWVGLSQKIQRVREQLNCLEGRDLVIFTDSYDVVFQTGTGKMVHDFKSYGKPFVFSSEAYSGWPYENTILPETPIPRYRSLNSGVWVAHVDDAKRIIDEAYGDRLSDSAYENDQGVFQQWYSINRDKAIVDYKNLLSTTTHYTENNIQCNSKGVIFNKHTGSIPCAIHGTNWWNMNGVYEALKIPSQSEMSSDEPSYRRHQAYMLAADHPWPAVMPGMKSSNGAYFGAENERVFRKSLGEASVILELGSGDGLGFTKFFLAHSNALLICNDSWEDDLYDKFCCNLWSERDRVVPLSMNITDGLHKVAEYKVIPDVIYMDVDYSSEDVLEQLDLIYRLFPKSMIFGNKFNFQSVRQDVLGFTKNHSITPVVSDEIWMIKKRTVDQMETVLMSNRKSLDELAIHYGTDKSSLDSRDYLKKQ
jgi:hypothetical protein